MLEIVPRLAVTVAGRVDTGSGKELETAFRVETADFQSITCPVGAVLVAPSTYSVPEEEPEIMLTGSGKPLETAFKVDTADFHRKTIPVGAVEVEFSTY